MDRVSLRQFILLTFLLGLAMKMFNLPVLMLRLCGRDAFIVLIAELIIDLILLVLVVLVVVLSGGKGFYELIENALGKVTAKVTAVVAGAYCMVKLYMMLVDVRLFFSNTVFPSTIGALHLIPLIVVLVYFALKPLSSAGRLSEIFSLFVIVGMVLLGVLTFPHVDFDGLRPLLADGPDKVFEGMSALFMWFGDFSLLLILTGKTGGGKKALFSLIAAVVSFICLTLFSAVLFASYGDIPELLTYGHSISSISQYAVGSFRFGRFDLVIFSLWLFAVFLSAGMMTLFFSRSMSYAFGAKAERILTYALGIAMFAAIALTINLNLAVEWGMVYFAIPSAVVQYGLPVMGIVALIAGRVRGSIRRKSENSEQKKQE